MNKGSNKRGELLVWPGVGPIGNSPSDIKEFENYVSSEFNIRMEFVQDLERKDGEVDTVIRVFAEDNFGSDIIFRMFCVHIGIYPISMISRTDYDVVSASKFFNKF
jgi:hypothetical protein